MPDNQADRVAQVMAQSEPLVDTRRLKSALTLYERAHEENPGESAFLYQLGALHYCYLGNGVEARRWFQATLAADHATQPGPVRRLRANACENLMLLSLSYDEYERCASELEALDPTNPILKAHRNSVREGRELGQPWSVILGSIGNMHHDPHDPHGAERNSESAATWHLLLTHRKNLRVARREWRNALLRYSADLLGTSASAGLTMRAALGWDEPEEIIFLLRPALPFVREYLDESGDDQMIQKILIAFERAFDLSKYRRRPSGASAQMGTMAPQVQGVPRRLETIRPQAQNASRLVGCLVVLLGVGLGAWAGHHWIVKVAPPWNAVVGAVIGLFCGAALIVRMLQKRE
ncbi:MAG: hypothetical protein WCG85_09940 [Polyangia bacterium]